MNLTRPSNLLFFLRRQRQSVDRWSATLTALNNYVDDDVEGRALKLGEDLIKDSKMDPFFWADLANAMKIARGAADDAPHHHHDDAAWSRDVNEHYVPIFDILYKSVPPVLTQDLRALIQESVPLKFEGRIRAVIDSNMVGGHGIQARLKVVDSHIRKLAFAVGEALLKEHHACIQQQPADQFVDLTEDQD